MAAAPERGPDPSQRWPSASSRPPDRSAPPGLASLPAGAAPRSGASRSGASASRHRHRPPPAPAPSWPPAVTGRAATGPGGAASPPPAHPDHRPPARPSTQRRRSAVVGPRAAAAADALERAGAGVADPLRGGRGRAHLADQLDPVGAAPGAGHRPAGSRRRCRGFHRCHGRLPSSHPRVAASRRAPSSTPASSSGGPTRSR